MKASCTIDGVEYMKYIMGVYESASYYTVKRSCVHTLNIAEREIYNCRLRFWGSIQRETVYLYGSILSRSNQIFESM